MKQSLSKLVSLAVLGLGAAAIVFGMQYQSAFANGESFTPITVSPTATYNQSTQTVSVTGSIITGTETFITQATCFGSTPGDYAVTGPLTPGNSNWSIVNSAGTTVASGVLGMQAYGAGTVFGYVCAGTSRQSPLTGFAGFTPRTSIDVSALPSGNYVLNVIIIPECVPSFGYASCSPAPPVATGNASFTIPAPTPPPTVSLTASPSTIAVGDTTTLTITTTNATSCTGSGSDDGIWDGNEPTSGTIPSTPGSAGTATYTLTCTGPGGQATASTNVTVNAPIGQLTVTSENSIYHSVPVSASWALTGNVPGSFVCNAASGTLWQGSTPCSGTQQIYFQLPTDNDSYTIPTSTETTTVSGYSFNSLEQVPIAEKQNDGIIGWAQLSLDNAFSTIANADQVTPTRTLTLGPISTSAAFTILWMPDANMQITTGDDNTVTLDSSNAATTPVTVTNAGTPGSAFTWSATAVTTSGGNWLKTPSGDSNPGVVNGQSGDASDNATISFDPSVVKNLPNGTYYGTVTFTGSDKNDNYNSIPSITVPVTLNVNNPVTTSVSVTCNPTTVLTNGTSACSAAVSGGGSNGVTWTTNSGSINASGNYTAPGSAGSATITACSTQSTSVCGTTEIAVNAVPTVSISATPQTITSGNTTELSWSSQYADSCNASSNPSSGGWSGSKSTTGNTNESPTSNTTYTITCTGPGGSASASTNVTVNPPAPLISLYTSSPVITAGGQTQLIWSSQYANSCSASSNPSSGGWSGSKSTGGNDNVSPPNSTTYTLTCTGSGGSATASTNVTVNQPTVTGVAVTCNPTAVLTKGNSACSATVSGTGNYSTGVTWKANFGSVDANGNYTAPGTAGSATITACSTQSGFTSTCGTAQITVNVPPPGPVVTLGVSPGNITLGQSVTLTINTANVTSCTGSGDWSGSQPTNGDVYETPGSVGTATYNISCTGPGGSATASASVVVNPVPAAGSIVVTSENADDSSILVPASWDLMGNVSGGIVCSAASGNTLWQGTSCSGTQQTYSGLPTDNDSYTIPQTETTAVPGYSFKSVSPSPAQTLASANPSTAFMILWIPDANVQISPGTVSLDSSNAVTANVTVTNTGAPASALAWTATAATTGGGNWLVAPSGDTIPGVVNGPSGNASDNATISFDSSVVNQLANGTYKGTVTFQVTDENDPNNQIAPITVSVTLTVAGVSQGYSCTSDNQCVSTTTNPQYDSLSSCNTACTSNPPPPPACTLGVNCPVCNSSLTANPTSIVVPESSNLSYSCSNVTRCQISGASTGKFSTPTDVPANGNVSTTPSITTTYTLACVNSNYAQNADNQAVSSATVTVKGSSYCEQNPNGVGCQ